MKTMNLSSWVFISLFATFPTLAEFEHSGEQILLLLLGILSNVISGQLNLSHLAVDSAQGGRLYLAGANILYQLDDLLRYCPVVH